MVKHISATKTYECPYFGELVGKINSNRDDTFGYASAYTTNKPISHFAEIIKQRFADCRISTYAANSLIVSIFDGDVLKSVVRIGRESEGNGDVFFASKLSNIVFDMFGIKEHVLTIHEILETNDDLHSKVSSVVWYYMDGSQLSSRTINLEQPKPSYDVFYPWIEDGVDDYIERYLTSDSSVAILLGPPGGGKTSFVRNLIWNKGLEAIISHDESILSADQIYVNFLVGSYDLMVIEDADVFLTSRENEGNRLMAKFLNISDGLVRPNKKKKIIFTANLTSIEKIDSALMRPGRCFDTMVFRPLVGNEINDVYKTVGIDRRATEHEEMTLAEIFNHSKEDISLPRKPKRKLGFI